MNHKMAYPIAGGAVLVVLLFVVIQAGLPVSAKEETPVPDARQGAPQCRLYLSPEFQAKTGLPGEIVTYRLVLYNYNPYSESFFFEVGSELWKTHTQVEQVGPVPPMGMAPVTFTVQIPQNAPPFSFDIVQVYARSIYRDSHISNIAYLKTITKNALQLSFEPPALQSAQAPGELVTQTLIIRNGYSFTLNYQLSLPNQLPRDQWLSISGASGALPSQQSVSLPVVFYSHLKRAGTYTQAIYLDTNAPDHERIAIPVRMEVVEPPYHLYMPLLNH